MSDFLRELSVSFSGDQKEIVKPGIGVIVLKVADLFEDGAGVCDVEKGTGDVAKSFSGVFNNFSW